MKCAHHCYYVGLTIVTSVPMKIAPERLSKFMRSASFPEGLAYILPDMALRSATIAYFSVGCHYKPVLDFCRDPYKKKGSVSFQFKVP